MSSEPGPRSSRSGSFEPAFPILVKVAGIIWIIYGCLALAAMSLNVAMFALSTPANERQRDDLIAAATCSVCCVGPVAAVFILVGYQSIRGTANDTLGNGIGSIIFGALGFASGITLTLAAQLFQAAMVLAFAALLISAGVLALIARSDYRLWRQARKARLVPEE
jgi:hypothetical protein